MDDLKQIVLPTTFANSPHAAIAPLILVVDDDSTMRILLKAALEEDRYRVAVAMNGEQGLSSYLNLAPDMVLLDAMMGTMSGFELCEQIRRHTLGQNIPILMLTSLDDQASINQAFAVGATDYVTKPIHWGVLSKRVQRLFQQSQILQTQNDYIEEIRRMRTWSSVLETLALAQAEKVSILETFESLLPKIQAAFAIDAVLLLIPPTCPRVEALGDYSFIQTGVAPPQNVATHDPIPTQWTATANLEITADLCAVWTACRREGSPPWSDTDQKNWDLLALILRQGLASILTE